MKDRRAHGRLLVRGVIDLEVVDGEAGLLERVEDALRPLAATRLGLDLQTIARSPDFRPPRAIASLARAAPSCPALEGVLGLGLRELRVHGGDEDPLLLGIRDERAEGVIARVTHHRDAVRLWLATACWNWVIILFWIPVGPLGRSRRGPNAAWAALAPL